MHFFQERLSGSIANNITILADSVEEITSIIFPRIIRGIVHIAVALLALSFASPLFSFALFVWAAGFTGISLLYAKKIRNLANDCAETQSAVSGRIVDSVMNFFIVRLFFQSKFEFFLR